MEDNHLISTKKVLFFCEYCNYETSIKCNYDKHISTTKHKHNVENKLNIIDINENIVIDKLICYNCNKSFNHRTTLWRHKQKCVEEINESDNDDNIGIEIGSEIDSEIGNIIQDTNTTNILLQSVLQNITILKEQNMEIISYLKSITNTKLPSKLPIHTKKSQKY